MYRAAAAAAGGGGGDLDEKDKGERVGWQKVDESVKVVVLYAKVTASYPT
jgi:hypothetical protein